MTAPATRPLIRSALSAAALALAAAAAPAGATMAWNEAVNGDFSGDGLAPTTVPLVSGINEIWGTTGRSASSGLVDRDYFTITIPSGFVLASMELLEGTVAIGSGSFIGLMAGPLFTVPPDTESAAGLLGWTLFDEGNIGGDLLLFMATPSFGSTGFETPLQAGTYAFWVQETAVGTASYRFALDVAVVPEPATALSLLAGLGVLGGLRARAARRSKV